MNQQEIDRLFEQHGKVRHVDAGGGKYLSLGLMYRAEFTAAIQSAIAQAAAEIRQQTLEKNRIQLGVIGLHSNAALRDDFYRVADDLRRAGSIVDVWLMDMQAVLKRHGYQLEVYREDALAQSNGETER